MSKPQRLQSRDHKSWQPASSGDTDFRRTSSFVSSTASDIRATVAASHPPRTCDASRARAAGYPSLAQKDEATGP